MPACRTWSDLWQQETRRQIGTYDRDGALHRRPRERSTDPAVETDKARVGLGHEEHAEVAGANVVGRHRNDETDDTEEEGDDDVRGALLASVRGPGDDEGHDRGESEGGSAKEECDGPIVAERPGERREKLAEGEVQFVRTVREDGAAAEQRLT